MQRPALYLGIGLSLAALPAIAEQKAHEHGHAKLNVAIEDGGVEMELIAPGADIVGFEHQPASDADHAAIDAAVATFQKGLFTLPAAAGCELEATGIYSALLPGGKPVHSGDHHHDEDHKDEHGHDDHGHDHDKKDDDHAHDDHGHDHAKKDDDHAHDDHGHGDHKDGDEHTEFKVHFHYDCEDTAALTGMQTTYFSNFPNAQELDVAALTATGQVAAELTPDSASIDF